MKDKETSSIEIKLPEVTLRGDYYKTTNPIGLIVFAHGSGSSRKSPRNQMVAQHLQGHNFNALLLDLLLESEDSDSQFDIDLLSRRLVETLQWAHTSPQTRALPLGLFGASTGAAAAVMAAALRPDLVGAVVSRGGRVDLAANWLSEVKAPTLLIVGSADTTVLELNRRALPRLAATKNLTVIPRATHLFEEAGALEEVAAAATIWFEQHLHTNHMQASGE